MKKGQRTNKSRFKKDKRERSFLLSVIVNAIRLFVVVVLALSLAVLGVIFGIAKGYVDTAPNLDLAKIDEQAETSFFYDKEGNLITDYKGTENRVMVKIENIPPNLRNAFVAVEDVRFYSHNGIDLKRIVGAFVKNLSSGSHQGGSTITQQLIKNTVLTSEMSYKRKIQEAYLAMQLEAKYSKDEILESYLNTIFLGENYYGVKVAAEGYFGKQLHELSLRECAMLAGITTNPYYYNIRRNFFQRKQDGVDYVKISNNRTNYVLRVMYENQMITNQEYQNALNPETARVLQESPIKQKMYPYAHYVEYAISDVIETLLKIKKLDDTKENRAKMEQELRRGGYKVYLAIDKDIQKKVEDILINYKNYPKLRDPKDKEYRYKLQDGTFQSLVQPQAACVVIDYRTGEIKAIVGSRTEVTQRRTLNRAVNMNMPVGSAIKPIGVFAPAFEMGAGAGQVVYNMPLPIEGWRGSNGKDSWPKNYGGSSYRGPETLRTALTKSDNTATAQALMQFVGVERSSDFLQKLGVKKSHIQETPFGVALGSSGITPLEMAAAYGALGNLGTYQKPLSFLAIMDRNGNLIYDAHQNHETRQVFSPATAWLTIDIMKDVVSKGTGGAAKLKGQTVAGKTGTNSEQRGVVFTGLTGYYSASVWIGHDGYKPLSSKTTGGNSAAKLWSTVMKEIHQGLENKPIISQSPEELGLVKVATCNVSGQLATAACYKDANNHGVSEDYVRRENVPQVECQMHKLVRLCRLSGRAATEFCPQESVEESAVVVLPQGHPLQRFIGTQYQSVLEQYFGPYATLPLTDDANYNQSLLQGDACYIHKDAESAREAVPYINPMFTKDANALLEQANTLLNKLDSSSENYSLLLEAINKLNAAVQNPSSEEQLLSCMGELTQIMGRVQ